MAGIIPCLPGFIRSRRPVWASASVSRLANCGLDEIDSAARGYERHQIGSLVPHTLLEVGDAGHVDLDAPLGEEPDGMHDDRQARLLRVICGSSSSAS